MTREQAYKAVQKFADTNERPALTLIIELKSYTLESQDIDLKRNIDAAVAHAWAVGRSGNPFKNLAQLSSLNVSTISIPLTLSFDEQKLRSEIADIAKLADKPGKDVRLHIADTTVSILTDVKDGHVVDQQELYERAVQTIRSNSLKTESLTLKKIEPSVKRATADMAKKEAESIIASALRLTDDFRTFLISRTKIGTWVLNEVQGETLTAGLDSAAISSYVTTVAAELDAEP